MKELEDKIINQLPLLEYYKWYAVKSEDVLNFMKLLINQQTLSSPHYLELNTEYTKFRKLNIQN